MRSEKLLLPVAGLVIVGLALDLVHVRMAGAAASQDVNVISPVGPTSGAVLCEVTGPVRTRANPVLTHVGTRANEIVTIVWSTVEPFTFQVNSDGTRTLFTGVPAENDLVITDVLWEASDTSASASQLTLDLVGPTDTNRVLAIPQSFDESGHIGLTVNMTTGIGVSAGTELAIDVDYSLTASHHFVYLRGYYTAAAP